MENTLRKISLSLLLATGLNMGNLCQAEVLKLSEAPLSQIIELYSKATGKNIFVDDTIQQQRKITAHLQDMSIEEAFGIVQKTLGLESCTVGTNTMLLYPPERAQRYQPEMKPFVLRAPAGIDVKWLLGIINTLLPNLKATPVVGDQRALLFFGTEGQIIQTKEIARKVPEIAVKQKFWAMTEHESLLALKELKNENVILEVQSNGLKALGSEAVLKKYGEVLENWRNENQWDDEVFTPEYLEGGKLLKAAEATKGRALITDLGGTGSLLIEGPKAERSRITKILKLLDQQSKKQQYEISLGEIKPETIREAVRSLGVESVGDRNMVLVGKTGAIEQATTMLTALGQKKKQVLIQFHLAEVAKSKLKTLGIDLDKNAYSYGEIKQFHPNDTLPLILRVLDEGKDSKMLAQPNLRVIEGEEAKVTIGDRIPLEVAATAQTDAGSVLKLNTQLSWVDVGIKMTIKNVVVNPDNSIRMGLKGEVSSVVATTKQGYPQIRTREAESILRVNNGNSVIMGGLLSQEERENNNKIPLIGNLPIFGGLARSKDKQRLATEIIMVVTAQIAEE